MPSRDMHHEWMHGQAATLQAPRMVWTAGEDALLAMGIRRLGSHAHNAIAATFLPTWSGDQVKERVKHMSHFFKRANVVKVGEAPAW
jgi:hypothetical protein